MKAVKAVKAVEAVEAIEAVTDKPLLVLIAGPYRSGAAGEPAAMAADPARLQSAAWPVFAAGHLPVIGEWIARPVLRPAPQGAA